MWTEASVCESKLVIFACFILNEHFLQEEAEIKAANKRNEESSLQQLKTEVSALSEELAGLRQTKLEIQVVRLTASSTIRNDCIRIITGQKTGEAGRPGKKTEVTQCVAIPP